MPTLAVNDATDTTDFSLDGGEKYAVKLDVFEGPLDLLLHLIRVNEVDITDIPIASISTQYLEYLDLMRDLNIDVAAEYLLMAATLAWIKSRMLLPYDDQQDEDDGFDPRLDLMERLLEYQRFKEASSQLDERMRLGRDVFVLQSLRPDEIPEEERELKVGIFELVEAFKRVLMTPVHSGAAHELVAEQVTVREQMIRIMNLVDTKSSTEFYEIFKMSDGRTPTRPLIVATFLAILELTKMNALCVYQNISEFGSPEGVIRIRRNEAYEGAEWENFSEET